MNKGLLYIFLLMACGADAQIHWEVNAQKQNGHTFLFKIRGTIDNGWHIYCQDDLKNGLTPLHIRILDSDYLVTGQTEGIRDLMFDHAEEKVFKTHFTFSQFVNIKDDIPASVPVSLSGFAANDSVFIPVEETKQIALEGGASDTQQIRLSTINLSQPLSDCGEKQNAKSWLAIFLLGLAGGLIALVTPCVFPMIPLTVSFFIKQDGKKFGMIYGIFIFLIYVSASIPFHIAGTLNPQIFNSISTNVWVNLAFFIIFVLFSLSFFGLFEISMPSFLTNRISSKSGVASMTGIFFMALTLVAVSFSCTGPILGSLLAGSAKAGAWALTAGMTGFGIALGAPFMLFAIFPQWINSVPKSGAWLDTIKKTLAFIELAFAFKFLSNADLVGHWGILKREVFISVWILISVAMAAWLFGVFGTRMNEKIEQQVIKMLMSLFVMFFATYLALGLLRWNDLEMLSGFPPPKSYSIIQRDKDAPGIIVNDYDRAVALAKKSHKPILLDFTGWACVNCRKMEEDVWSAPSVSSNIRENYILVSLYVDDRKALKETMRFRDRDLLTEGDRWAAFESENFAQVTQPLYVLLSPEGKLLNHPVGYTPDEKKYNDWLDCGISSYKNQIAEN